MIYSDTIILADNHLESWLVFSIYAPRTPYKNFEFCGGAYFYFSQGLCVSKWTQNACLVGDNGLHVLRA